MRLEAFLAGGVTLPVLTPIVALERLAETIEEEWLGRAPGEANPFSSPEWKATAALVEGWSATIVHIPGSPQEGAAAR